MCHGFQIRHSDEVFLADLHYWNVIFLNDSAEKGEANSPPGKPHSEYRGGAFASCVELLVGSLACSVLPFLHAKFQVLKNQSPLFPGSML